MFRVSLDEDQNRDSLTPRPADEYLDLTLSAEEIAQAVFGVEREALEIAEAVETETGDLAFEADLSFAGSWPSPWGLGGWVLEPVTADCSRVQNTSLRPLFTRFADVTLKRLQNSDDRHGPA